MSYRSLALSALVCLFASGCYGPGMRGPGYGYGYPQNGYFSGAPYGQPQQIGQPYPGSYTVPGGVVLPPSNSAPYTPPGSTIIEGGASSIDDGWSGQDDGFGSGSDSGVVPRPPGDMFGTGSNGFDSTEPFGSRSTPTGIDTTASVTRPVSTIGSSKTYGYNEDHTVLRGVLGPDPQLPNQMQIIYSLQETDAYHGRFTLIPDDRLGKFRTGDIVEIRGRIQGKDKWGKATYQIGSIRPGVAR